MRKMRQCVKYVAIAYSHTTDMPVRTAQTPAVILTGQKQTGASELVTELSNFVLVMRYYK